MSDKVFLGTRMAQLDTSPSLAPVSKVILAVDSENAYIAGDDTGRTIEVTCPYGTQEMANNILAALSSYTYTPAMAQDAILDPAAEIGDGLTMGGVYTVLAQSTLTFDGLMTSDAGAPGQAEQESEYKYQSPVIADINWQLAETRSLISKTSEEILLQVENELKGLSSSFSVQLQQIQSQVTGLDGQMSSITQTVDSITTRVNGLEGDYSSIEQKVDSLKLAVSNGSTSSMIQLKAGSTIISSENITMSGLVTYTGLSSGTTTINGACIKTGTIDADRLNLTGEITFTDFDNSTQNTINNANTNASTALSTAISVSGTVSGWTYPGTTEINGSAIRTGTVEASILRGGSIQILDDLGRTIGEFTVENTGFRGLKSITLSSEEVVIDVTDPEGEISLQTRDTGIEIGTNEIITITGDLRPKEDDYYWIGESSRAWSDIYLVNDPTIVSDKSKKTSISYKMGLYEEFFDALKPATYLLKNGTSGRTHIGLISQDVEEALFASNLTSFDFAGFIKSPVLDKNGKETGEYNYALRYGEFIALCIDQIQKLKSRISKMEAIQGV